MNFMPQIKPLYLYLLSGVFFLLSQYLKKSFPSLYFVFLIASSLFFIFAVTSYFKK